MRTSPGIKELRQANKPPVKLRIMIMMEKLYKIYNNNHDKNMDFNRKQVEEQRFLAEYNLDGRDLCRLFELIANKAA